MTATNPETAGTGIGAPVRRREDARFITGNGRYTDDINRPGQAFAVFLRSPVARGVIRGIDIAAAVAAPGVVRVLTGADSRADGLGDLPCGWMVHSRDGSEMAVPAHPPLAVERVNYVGEPYGVVIAETLDQARAAADLVEPDIDELDALVSTAAALDGDDIHDNVPGNRSYNWEIGDAEATEAAFAGAAHVTRVSLHNNRLIPNAIEPRAAIGEYDSSREEFTLHTTSQNPHLARLIIAAFVGLAPEHRLRVIAPDVGGGFGSKIFIYAEEVICAWASKRCGRPVKWTALRHESFLTDAHGRDHETVAELALDDAGTFLGLRVRTRANLGAYLSTFASAVPTYLYGTLMAGQYRTPAIHVEVDGVFTNTVPVDAYRGAGRPEATYVVERVVEVAAREIGMDPVELRRRNLIGRDQFPYETPVALVYDVGDYEASLNRALALIDYDGYPARRAASEARGHRRGIGFSCYIEACGLAPSKLAISLGAGVGLYESGEVRVNATGSVTLFTGSHSHGQGHETTFAQVISDLLGVPYDDVELVHGDTGRMDFGLGTYGSRSAAVGASALVRAGQRVVDKGRRIAAAMLEGDVPDITFEDGVYTLANSNRSVTFQEVAFQAYVPSVLPDDMEPGLSEKAFYDPENFTYPAGTHVCEVEIDPDTGVTEVVRFVAVDDFGRVINPLIVEGQVHGGLAQGIGQALLEQAVYDDYGQLQTGSYMDYCMPRADDVPDFDVDMTTTHCTHNPLGVKGCGEAGAIGAPAAVMNAVTDALGNESITMPATPEKVWRNLRAATSPGA